VNDRLTSKGRMWEKGSMYLAYSANPSSPFSLSAPTAPLGAFSRSSSEGCARDEREFRSSVIAGLGGLYPFSPSFRASPSGTAAAAAAAATAPRGDPLHR